VVAVYALFTSGIILQHVEECMHEEPDGLFKMYPDLSGVLFFDESLPGYRFRYLANPVAQRPWTLPSGTMDVFQ
jgi:hypothetical protein